MFKSVSCVCIVVDYAYLLSHSLRKEDCHCIWNTQIPKGCNWKWWIVYIFSYSSFSMSKWEFFSIYRSSHISFPTAIVLLLELFFCHFLTSIFYLFVCKKLCVCMSKKHCVKSLVLQCSLIELIKSILSLWCSNPSYPSSVSIYHWKYYLWIYTCWLLCIFIKNNSS